MIVVGLMSGTSADGIDATVVHLEGSPPRLSWEVLAHVNCPHTDRIRAEIFACFRPETSSVDHLCRLNFELGEAFAQAALDAIAAAHLNARDVNLIGSHGQTVWHIPPQSGEIASTLQIGEPAIIAERTGLPVVSNFRTRDMAAGGHGAPLVPLVDWILFSHPTLTRAAQNIGGIANVTFLSASGERENVLAFDTGPGNMLIDEVVRLATNGAWNYDHEGSLASQGLVNESLLKDWLTDPFFDQSPPRTTGRELFGVQRATQYWLQAIEHGLNPNDIVATLTALTARSIEHAYRNFLPVFPEEVIISGGGAHNSALMRMLAERLAPARITTSNEFGLNLEAKEAVAFAVLAYETWHKRCGNLPSATGASHIVILGSVTY
jgi:anhydro-N-acetylmuramic acid kinase